MLRNRAWGLYHLRGGARSDRLASPSGSEEGGGQVGCKGDREMKRLVSFGWKRFQFLFLSFGGDCGTRKSKQEGEMGPVDRNKWAANFSLR